MRQLLALFRFSRENSCTYYQFCELFWMLIILPSCCIDKQIKISKAARGGGRRNIHITASVNPVHFYFRPIISAYDCKIFYNDWPSAAVSFSINYIREYFRKWSNGLRVCLTVSTLTNPDVLSNKPHAEQNPPWDIKTFQKFPTASCYY
jgi:hypothetical protein